LEHLLKLAEFISEYWYKMVMLIGFVLLVIGLTMPIQAIPNIALVLIALGTFLIGLGEWLNHPHRVRFNPHLHFQIHVRSRKNSLGGVLTVISGVAVVGFGIVVAARQYLP